MLNFLTSKIPLPCPSVTQKSLRHPTTASFFILRGGLIPHLSCLGTFLFFLVGDRSRFCLVGDRFHSLLFGGRVHFFFVAGRSLLFVDGGRFHFCLVGADSTSILGADSTFILSGPDCTPLLSLFVSKCFIEFLHSVLRGSVHFVLFPVGSTKLCTE